jgi:hypothetical protein
MILLRSFALSCGGSFSVLLPLDKKGARDSRFINFGLPIWNHKKGGCDHLVGRVLLKSRGDLTNVRFRD